MGTKAKKRVEIAKMVLDELDEEWIVASQGSYFECSLELANVNPSKKLQTVLSDQQCETCAIGALFVAAIDAFDSLLMKDLSLNEYGDLLDTTMVKYLGQWFTKKQLRLMEVAFEGTAQPEGFQVLKPDEITAAQKFHHKVLEDRINDSGFAEDTLKAIMQNVIEHKGAFKP